MNLETKNWAKIRRHLMDAVKSIYKAEDLVPKKHNKEKFTQLTGGAILYSLRGMHYAGE